jgi:hypothetical protein
MDVYSECKNPPRAVHVHDDDEKPASFIDGDMNFEEVPVAPACIVTKQANTISDCRTAILEETGDSP